MRPLFLIFALIALIAFGPKAQAGEKGPLSAPAPTAEDSAAENAERAADIQEGAKEIIKHVQYQLAAEAPACFTCSGVDAPPQDCADAYADFYSKPTLDFRITFGYTDMANDVVNAEDGPRREVWVQKLLRPCPKNAVGTCGFKKDPDDLDHFTKSVAGPDGKNHLVNLHLVSSSVSVDDHLNRTKLQAQQDAQTHRAESNFFDHVCSADLPVYAGHARVGGGPSFAPPILKADGLTTDEHAYADHASENRMLSILRSCPNPPKILGLFACDAGKWFSNDVRNATAQKSGVVSSQGLTEPEIVFAQAYAMLDSVLALRCNTEFVHSINSLKNVLRQDGHGATLTGFFTDKHPKFTMTPDEPAIDEKFRSESPLLPQTPIHPAQGGDWPAEQMPAAQGAKGVK